jgi:type IV secretion system protein VirB10
MAGTQIPGVLITGINSDLPGQILGQVSQNTFDSVTGKYLLIPQGTKIVGEYDSRIGYGQERVLIVWTRLLFPNGKSLSLEGMPGVDMSGYAGLADKVNNHYLKLLSGVVVSSVLSAGSRVAQGGSRTVDPSLGQLGAEGFAMNVDDVGQQIARKNLNIQPTIEIEPGKRFSIFVNKDLVLEPYR